MIYCMKCGSKLPDEAKFCKYCGFSTGLNEGTVNNNVEPETSPKVEAEPIHMTRVEVEIKTSPNVELEFKTSPKLDVEVKPAPIVETKIIQIPVVEPVAAAPAVVAAPPVAEVPPVVVAPPVVLAEIKPTPVLQAEVVAPPVVQAQVIAPPIVEAAPGYPHSIEDEIINPRSVETEIRYPRRNETSSDIKHPFKPEIENNELFNHSVKSQTSNPFEKNHQKSTGYYIDNEFHGGLARKNIGGVYNQTRDCVEGGKWGYVDTTRREVIPAIYDTATVFKDGFAKVSIKGRYGILNKKGNETIPLIYSDVTFTSEGLTGVCLNDKWGFIDAKGKKVVPFKYSDVTPFEDGLAGVCKNGKWGLIDKSGRIVVSFMYNDASQFENYKKSNSRDSEDKPDRSDSLMYRLTIGIIKAWAALFGEVVFLFVINHLLPTQRTNFYWMLVAATIAISFLLFYLIIDTIKGAVRKNAEQ